MFVEVKPSDVALSFLPSESRPSSPELLSSDDEAVPNTAAVPLTLRMLPPHFPSLPPKHTYMKTPVCVWIPRDDGQWTFADCGRSIGFATEESCSALFREEAQNSRPRAKIATEPPNSHRRGHEQRRCRTAWPHRQLGDWPPSEKAMESPKDKSITPRLSLFVLYRPSRRSIMIYYE